MLSLSKRATIIDVMLVGRQLWEVRLPASCMQQVSRWELGMNNLDRKKNQTGTTYQSRAVMSFPLLSTNYISPYRNKIKVQKTINPSIPRNIHALRNTQHTLILSWKSSLGKTKLLQVECFGFLFFGTKTGGAMSVTKRISYCVAARKERGH